ncbi:MAG TPA: 6-bladed beta-propeller [Bacteroidales bacterium]|nr:6-bladed beta-propeller [Bacteroidales bacterium]
MKINNYLICSLLLVYSCTQRKSIPEYNLEKTTESRVINLSEMLTDIRTVRLETTDETLLGNNIQYLVGDHYIVSIDNDKIVQFTDSGKFVRILAKAGKGPGEFLRVDAFALDDLNNILYINHRGDQKHISAYDLNTGILSARFLTGIENIISRIDVVNDTTLLIVPRMNKEYNMYYLSTSGIILNGIAPPAAKGIGLETSIFKLPDFIYYMPKEFDTLYKVTDVKTEPDCLFNVEDRFTFINNETGNFVYLSGMTSSFIIANKVHARIDLNDDGETFSMNADKLTKYWIDRKDHSVAEISGFNNDYFNIKENRDPWDNYLFTSNNMGYVCYPPVYLKKLIDSTLTYSEPDKILKDRISTLNDQLKEDDNPVLVVGRLK